MGVEHGETAGWRTIALAGEALRVTVLPDKGASVYALEHVASGVDVHELGPLRQHRAHPWFGPWAGERSSDAEPLRMRVYASISSDGASPAPARSG